VNCVSGNKSNGVGNGLCTGDIEGSVRDFRFLLGSNRVRLDSQNERIAISKSRICCSCPFNFEPNAVDSGHSESILMDTDLYDLKTNWDR
jgi:hypothetical protein